MPESKHQYVDGFPYPKKKKKYIDLLIEDSIVTVKCRTAMKSAVPLL
jgi:hypothetical protein